MSEDNTNDRAVKPEDGKKAPKSRRVGQVLERGENKWLIRETEKKRGR